MTHKLSVHTALSAVAFSDAVPVTVMAFPARAANPPPTLYSPSVKPEDKIAAASTDAANLIRSLASKFILLSYPLLLTVSNIGVASASRYGSSSRSQLIPSAFSRFACSFS